MAKKKMSRSTASASYSMPRVTKRPMEHSNFNIEKAKNGYVARVTGWLPDKKTKTGMVGGKHYSDMYLCKTKASAKEILKKAIK